MSKYKWSYQPLNEMMGNTSSNLKKSHNSEGLSVEEVLVREAISNSQDAIDPKFKQLQFKITEKALTGTIKAQSIESLQLKEFYEKLGASNLYVTQKKFIEKLLSDAAEPFYSLELADYQTKGLSGKLEAGADNDYYNLIHTHGADNKTDSLESTSGSYGFGKTTFLKVTDLVMMSFFSTIDGTDKNNEGHFARLMTFGAFKSINKLNGFGYLGGGTRKGSNFVLPIVNEEAIEQAKKIGFTDRENKIGTSILIHGCDLNVKLIDDIVNTFWPVVIGRDKLQVHLKDSDEHSWVSRPKKHPVGKIMINLDNNIDSGVDTVVLHKAHKIDLAAGKYTHQSFNIQKEDLIYKLEFTEQDFTAIIRNTGMVINYHFTDSSSTDEQYGVLYKADDEVSGLLKSSENASHNSWNPHHPNVIDNHGPEGVEYIKSLNRRIPKIIKTIRSEKLKASAATGEATFINALLSSAFKSKDRGAKKVPDGLNPKRWFHINQDPYVISKGEIKHTANFQVVEDCKADELEIFIKPRLGLIGESHSVIPGSLIKLMLIDPAGNEIAEGNSLRVPIKIMKKIKQSYTVVGKTNKDLGGFAYKLDWGAEIEIK